MGSAPFPSPEDSEGHPGGSRTGAANRAAAGSAHDRRTALGLETWRNTPRGQLIRLLRAKLARDLGFAENGPRIKSRREHRDRVGRP